ncbi:hypothetical protein RO3G_03506 [Rhizopus delemar RA 99-880]|uniref:Uncharacterized protein n=1 Tax=Rhizopus delemar (strain RA 99-880 / ATCC MYA-4621 / FGSC 9543 / NRRL 43880) TaxID=246409 RepID=I1BRH1_RHIO9|nr:hypothetical protein RO3G_03506 [Rhizopus delemar RA 99-880]|eukprot:EIE78801.1 hypothetical protein RO3G_03506 [Rhizopus delemar RA 99-880]
MVDSPDLEILNQNEVKFAVSIQLIAKELENIMLVMPHCLWASERMLSTTSLFKMS